MVRHKFLSWVATGLMLSAVAVLTGCSDDPDEGGIIGTGVMLQGVVSESTFASKGFVEVKSSDGQLTKLPVNATNLFSTTTLAGTGPWVLSVRTSADLAVYGIAYGDGNRNINRFSDLSLRSWFAQQSLDLDSEFASSGRFTDLPGAAEFDESVSSVFQLINPVLDSYSVSGDDAINAAYSINDQGVDGFLKQNSVLIDNDIVTFQYPSGLDLT